MTNPTEQMAHCAIVAQNMTGSISIVAIFVVVVAVKVVPTVIDVIT
jgi:hypothetical protein